MITRTFLVTVLGAVLAAPIVSEAKPLCISNSVNSYHLVLPKAKLKKGKSSPLAGYFNLAPVIAPAHGAAIGTADGTQFAFTVERGQALVGGAQQVAAADAEQMHFFFIVADGRFDVGDGGSGYIDGVGASFTVVDCAAEPAYP